MTIFTTAYWAPALVMDPPDSIPISEFMLNEEYGRHKFADSKHPFICGQTGKKYTAVQVKLRVELLARTMSHELGWHPNRGSEWDKMVAIFALNTVCHQVLMGTRLISPY